MAAADILQNTLESMNATDSTDAGKKDSKESEWYPLTSFAFMLRVELAFDLPCRAIKGLRRENEFDYIQEGGLNDYVHMKRKPISRPFTFQVERYVGLDYLDPLPLGVELVLPVLLFVNPYPFRNSSFFKPVRSYAFMGCTVTAKDYGELNAESSGLLVETTTIAFREMACIDLPSKWLNKSSWDFSVDKDGKVSYEGQGESNKNTRDQLLRAEAKRSKADMAKLAEEHTWPAMESAEKKAMKTPPAMLWGFDSSKKAGNDKRSYLHKENGTNTPNVEKTKDQMQAQAKQWPKTASAVKQEMKTPEARTSGAVIQEMKTPEASLWAFEEKKKAGNDKRGYLHREGGTNTPSAEKTLDQMQTNASIWPTKESARKDEMKTPQARSGGAVKQEMKTPEARQWPKEASAVQAPSSKAERRKWPDETSAQKAHTSKRKKTASSSKARKSSSSKAKSRVWPKTSSAQTAQTANIKGAGRTSSGGPGRRTSSSPHAGGR